MSIVNYQLSTINCQLSLCNHKAAAHNQQYSNPLVPMNAFMEHYDGNNHAENVGHTDQRISVGERKVPQDIHPQHA